MILVWLKGILAFNTIVVCILKNFADGIQDIFKLSSCVNGQLSRSCFAEGNFKCFFFVVVLDQGSSLDGNSRWELLLWLGSGNVLVKSCQF